MSTDSINLYDNVYSDFGSDVELAVRREAYEEDLGRSSTFDAVISNDAMCHIVNRVAALRD